MNPEIAPETIVSDAVRKFSYSRFPFISKQSIKANLFGLIVLTGILVFCYYTSTLTLQEVIVIVLFSAGLQALYYVFYVIPSVLYLRKTGRFLYIPPGYSFRLERAPFYSPLGRDPIAYGGTAVKWPYLKGTFWMVVFLFVVVMPFAGITGSLVGLFLRYN